MKIARYVVGLHEKTLEFIHSITRLPYEIEHINMAKGLILLQEVLLLLLLRHK